MYVYKSNEKMKITYFWNMFEFCLIGFNTKENHNSTLYYIAYMQRTWCTKSYVTRGAQWQALRVRMGWQALRVRNSEGEHNDII